MFGQGKAIHIFENELQYKNIKSNINDYISHNHILSIYANIICVVTMNIKGTINSMKAFYHND